MKYVKASYAMGILFVVLLHGILTAQPQTASSELKFELAKDKAIMAKALFDNTTGAGDTTVASGLDSTVYHATLPGTATPYVKMPFDYGRAVIYVGTDSTVSGDTLTITVQGSSNGRRWFTNSTFTAILGTGGHKQYARKEILYADRYMRLVNKLGIVYSGRWRIVQTILPLK